MSYLINVEYRELQERAHVTIYGYSENFKSAQISQLQCIGWLYGIKNRVEDAVSKDFVENPDYFREALTRLAGLTERQATEMDSMSAETDIFEFACSIISQKEKDLALNLEPKYYDDFWSEGLISSLR